MIGVGVGLPAHHNKVTGPIAMQNIVLNMRVHHRTRHTETHVPVGGRIERIPGSQHLGLPRRQFSLMKIDTYAVLRAAQG